MYITDITTGQNRAIDRVIGSHVDSGLFSPTGMNLAMIFRRSAVNEVSLGVLYNRRSLELMPFGEPGGTARIGWLADGAWLLLVRGPEGHERLVMLDVAGRNKQQVTLSAAGVHEVILPTGSGGVLYPVPFASKSLAGSPLGSGGSRPCARSGSPAAPGRG